MWSTKISLENADQTKSSAVSQKLKKSLWHYFNPQVNQALEKIYKLVNSSKHQKFILGIISIENMASIIFSYGDEISITKTKELQPVIKKLLGRNSKIIRVSVNEFLYSCPYQDEASYLNTIDKLSKQIRKFGTDIIGTPIFFSFKIGAALMDRSMKVEEMLDRAFIALYECRNIDTLNHCMFSQISEKMYEYKKQMEMAVFFQNVIANNKLRLAWQPVICSKTGTVKSYEALLRIITEDNSIISAGPYVSIAEKYGYVTDIDRHTLHTVIKELETHSEIKIGLNISSLTIDDSTWLEDAKRLLKDPDIAKRLIVEITETGIQRHIDKTIAFVESIQALGCQVAIDDFGAGYTSFLQLKLLNVDLLKIDGVFIKDLHTNHNSQLFVKTLLNFAKAFGIKTVAEFVENGEIAKILMELGVDYLQGYYFDKPLSHKPWLVKGI